MEDGSECFISMQSLFLIYTITAYNLIRIFPTGCVSILSLKLL